MKKNLLFLMVAVLAIGFTSCDSDDDKPKEETLTTISISPSELSMEKGTTKRLNAVTDPSGWVGEFVWSSSNEEVFTVDNKGNVTAKDVESGEAIITVEAAGKKATATVRIKDVYDDYHFELTAGWGKKPLNDSVAIFTMYGFTQDAFIGSTGAFEGNGLILSIKFAAKIGVNSAGDPIYNPWYFLGKTQDGKQNLNMSSLDYDAWKLANVTGGDPTPMYGKFSLGKMYPDRVMQYKEAKMSGQEPTDEMKTFMEGSQYFQQTADGQLWGGALTSASLRFDTLSFTSHLNFKGTPIKSSITQFDFTFEMLPVFKTIALAAGDVFPTPYFGDLAGQQVTEAGNYVAYPLELLPTRVLHYTEDYTDKATPSSAAPRYLAKGRNFLGAPLQLVDGNFVILQNDMMIQAAPKMSLQYVN